MLGNIFAGCVIGMVLVALVVVKAAGIRPTVRSGLMGLGLTVISFVVIQTISAHACRRGGPYAAQWLTAVLAGLVYAAVPSYRVKIPVVIALLVAGFLLSSWGMELVHHQPYVGNPNWPDMPGRITATRLRETKEVLRSSVTKHTDLVLAPGWIEESWQAATGEPLFSSPPGYLTAQVGRYWHTWFTGIYYVQEKRNGIWCPGGPVRECVEKLEVREREEGATTTASTQP